MERDKTRVRRKNKKGRREWEGKESGQHKQCKQAQMRRSIFKKRNSDWQMRTSSLEKSEGKGAEGKGEGGAGMALHASRSIRRSGLCPVHGDVPLRASVAGERQEVPRA